MKVAILDEDAARGASVEAGLRASGVRDILRVEETGFLLNNLLAFEPDIVIADFDNPSRDALEQILAIGRAVERPVALFVEEARDGDVERAIEAGVSAYVVDGLKPERVRSVIEAAIARYRAFSSLQKELDTARTELSDTRDVERAKALLMERRGVDEPQAYKMLRSQAMRERRRIGEVARALVDAERMLSGGPDEATARAKPNSKKPNSKKPNSKQPDLETPARHEKERTA